MQDDIMVGCDLHDKTMLLKIARGRSPAVRLTWPHTPDGRREMLADLRRRAAEARGARVVFAYEASGLGFRLFDFLDEAGVECHVLAPTRIAKSVRHRRTKCDDKDAERILELLRGYVLAGNPLPDVWVPDLQTREDREVVRARLDVTLKTTALKSQVRTLLKRHGTEVPEAVGDGWCLAFRAWLRGLCSPPSVLPGGARVHLGTLLRQLAMLEEEIAVLDREVEKLAGTDRYAECVRRMMAVHGVGCWTAMVYLAEMGDLTRFTSRKEVGAYVGLTPSSDETGDGADRKGHITHQGSWRVRKMLCQAVWARLRKDAAEKAHYDALVARNPKKKKIAVVACMRRLAILLWHIGSDAQREAGIFVKAAA
jgi:transposase